MNNTYYLLITSDKLLITNRSNLSPNEIIDLNDNYYFFLPIIMTPCPSGYIYISETWNHSNSYNLIIIQNIMISVEKFVRFAKPDIMQFKANHYAKNVQKGAFAVMEPYLLLKPVNFNFAS